MSRIAHIASQVQPLHSFGHVKLASLIRKGNILEKVASDANFEDHVLQVVLAFEKEATLREGIKRVWGAAKGAVSGQGVRAGWHGTSKAGVRRMDTTKANLLGSGVTSAADRGAASALAKETEQAHRAAVQDKWTQRQQTRQIGVQRQGQLAEAYTPTAAPAAAAPAAAAPAAAAPAAAAGPNFWTRNVTPKLKSAGNWVAENPGASAGIAGGGILASGVAGSMFGGSQKTGSLALETAMDFINSIDYEVANYGYDDYEAPLFKLAEAYETRNLTEAFYSLREIVAIADAR